MVIGREAKTGVKSYIALFIESTYGTFPASAATGASTIEPLSIGFKTEIASIKLDQISLNRGFTKRVQTDKNVAGTLDQYLHPTESPILLALALGGGLTTSSLTGAFTHSISAGEFSSTINSISIQARKGDTHHWQFTGGRINSLKITAAIGEPIRCSYDFIFKDSTQTGSDISASLSISSVLPFTYVNGVYRYAATENSLTSTVEEDITGFELTVNNNLISDANVRKLGSDVLQTLPPTRRDIEFKVTQRFDTTTAWNRFIQNTQGSIELVFTGASVSAEHNYECRIRMPKVFVDSPDPEVPGPNDVLMSEINFAVLVDSPMTTTGRDIGITVINSISSY
jgi:hypothetical protein